MQLWPTLLCLKITYNHCIRIFRFFLPLGNFARNLSLLSKLCYLLVTENVGSCLLSFTQATSIIKEDKTES